MKRFGILLVTALVPFSAQSAEAEAEKGFAEQWGELEKYVSVKGGYTRADSYETGAFGAAAGVRVTSAVRAELEGMYYEKISEPSVFGTFDHKTATVMGHLYYDMGNASLRPYVGIGTGVAVIYDEKLSKFGSGFVKNTETATGFAAAVQIGASAKLSENVSVDAGMRYTYMYRPESDTFDSYQIVAFSGLLSLRFAF